MCKFGFVPFPIFEKKLIARFLSNQFNIFILVKFPTKVNPSRKQINMGSRSKKEKGKKAMQQKNIEKIVSDILSYGDMLLVANKGIGKTNALMVLARQFRALPKTRVIIFEDFPKWSLEFDRIPFLVVKDYWVQETQHVVDMENYFLRHERDYTVLKGTEIKAVLKKYKDILFVSEIQDIERQAFFIYSIIQWFYRRNYLRKFKNYNSLERIVFFIEESQNVFDSSTISKKIFNRLRKIYSVARNLEIHFILASQRLQDLNTKIRGRTRLLLGNPSLDDYELKIRRILRHSRFKKEILNFGVGEFLYCPKDLKVKFPLFQQQGKPYEISIDSLIPKPKPKPKPNIVVRILKKFGWIVEEEPEKELENPEEPEEDLDEQLEEDLGLLGEPDIEW